MGTPPEETRGVDEVDGWLNDLAAWSVVVTRPAPNDREFAFTHAGCWLAQFGLSVLYGIEPDLLDAVAAGDDISSAAEALAENVQLPGWGEGHWYLMLFAARQHFDIDKTIAHYGRTTKVPPA